MAKKKGQDKAKEVAVEEVVEEIEAIEEVKAVEPKAEPVVVQEKYTKVTPKVSGKKFIAGRWYTFTKDKEIDVTQEAKRVLKEAGAIYI